MNPKDNPLREVYLKHIESQKKSGISIKKYCLEHNIDAHKLSYYRTYMLKTSVKSGGFSKIEIKKTEKQALIKPQTANKLIDPIWLAKFINNLSSQK